MAIKIIIADDHGVVLAGTSMIIEAGITDASVEIARSYQELVRSMEQTNFDVLLLDINMPGTKNVQMVGELKEISPDIKIIIFSSYDEQVALQYIKAGANGYINKNYPENELISSIKAVIENGFYYSQELAKLAMSSLQEEQKVVDPRSLLSDRELEVFNLLLAGNSNIAISKILNVHISTTSTFKKRVMEKLGLPNIATLVKTYYNFNA